MLDYEGLLAMLDLDDPGDFQYFENFADLMETEEGIDNEILYGFFDGVDSEILGDLVNDYFEDMLEGVPDSETELYTMLTTIQMAMKNLAEAKDKESTGAVRFTDQFMDFRMWYLFDSEVYLNSTDDTGGTRRTLFSLRDALAENRADKLDGIIREFDFSRCQDFQPDDYAVQLTADTIQETMVDETEEYEQFETGKEKEGLLKTDFLYDDEFSDDIEEL